MTSSNEQLVPVTREQAVAWMEEALRNWDYVPRLSASEVEDVRAALDGFSRYRIRLTALRTPPAVEPDEGLVRGIRNQIHAIMAGLVDTVALIDKNPPGPFAVSRDIGESVQALRQVSLKLATLTPSIRAQALEEAAKPGQFQRGDRVKKHSGSWWEGKVVGTYSTDQTPEGYCVQLDAHPNGPVQIYPAAALRALKGGQGV